MSNKVKFPIRLILGSADGYTDTAITVVYELPNGEAAAESCCPWLDFKFVNSDEASEIEFFNITDEKETFDVNKVDWNDRNRNNWRIFEIRLRRDWQFKS